MTWRKNTVKTALIVTSLIVVAVVCRILSHLSSIPLVADKALNVVRTLVYFGLFAGWGVSLRRRVVQVQVRKLLSIVVVLILVWLTLRAVKYYFFTDETVIRYLWYAYYVPMMFIPAIALLVALSIGKNEGYRLPHFAFLLLLPPLIISALTLTNDLHQFVFRFPQSAAVWSEKDYSYGPGYALALILGVSSGGAALIMMFAKSRLPRNNPALWLPIVPFALAAGHAVLYALRFAPAMAIGWDLAAFECLAFAFFLESCIASGLIQSNTRYEDAFRALEGLSIRITDADYAVRYSTGDNESVPVDVLLRAESAPVEYKPGKIVHNLPIRGGRAVWTEDVSALALLHEKLATAKQELTERNEFLIYQYREEEEHRTVEEQNRLYDLLQSKTQNQIDAIRELIKDYDAAKTSSQKRRALARIVVLATFVKRRRDLALLSESGTVVEESTLRSALAESYKALSLLGIKGAFAVTIDSLKADEAAEAYDFFEAVAETATEAINYLNVHIYPETGRLVVSATLSGPADLKRLSSLYPSLFAKADEDGTHLRLTLEGGGV